MGSRKQKQPRSSRRPGLLISAHPSLRPTHTGTFPPSGMFPPSITAAASTRPGQVGPSQPVTTSPTAGCGLKGCHGSLFTFPGLLDPRRQRPQPLRHVTKAPTSADLRLAEYKRQALEDRILRDWHLPQRRTPVVIQ